MGLFSPRKDPAKASHGSPDDSNGSMIKSRWYGLPRSSRASQDTAGPSRHEHSIDLIPRRTMPLHRASVDSLPATGTDRTTITLAQRLNELAISNADGLLGDEEYRLLRQNLFERFGAGSQVPTESPIVKLSSPEASIVIDPNFRVHTYSPSMRSNMSRTSTVTSAMKGLVRKISGRSPSLATGIYSGSASPPGHSTASSIRIPRELSHRPSNASIRSTASRQPMDTRSVSSQKTGRSTRTNRTSASRGPPSSYNRRRLGVHSDGGDESSAEIRAEIAAVEIEKEQLLQNFDGLELTSMTKGGPGSGSSPNGAGRSSSLRTVTPDRLYPNSPPNPRMPPPLVPVIGPSIAERKLSLGLSSISPAKSTLFSRKRSSPNVSSSDSRHRSVSIAEPVPPTPPLPPMAMQPQPASVVDTTLQHIRRRRAETMEKYDQRLEYLRARLKGAELRERLIK